MLRVEAIVDREIFLHVREEDRNIDNVVPGRAGVFQDEPDIFEHGAALFLDVIAGDVASGVERDAGDFFAAAHARPDSGEKQKVADPLGVRERAHRFRRARAFERFAHFSFSDGSVAPPSRFCFINHS